MLEDMLPATTTRRALVQGLLRWGTRLAGLVLLAGILLVGSTAPRAEATTTVIDVGDFWFCSAGFQNGVCPTTIAVGDTVEWNFNSALQPHTSTDCGVGCGGPFGSVWDSGTIFGGGGTFQFTFSQAGTFPYYCTIHPTFMRGEITVAGAVGGIAELPTSAGTTLDTSESQGRTGIVTLAVGAVAAAMVGLAFYARRRLLQKFSR